MEAYWDKQQIFMAFIVPHPFKIDMGYYTYRILADKRSSNDSFEIIWTLASRMEHDGRQ